MSNGWTGGQYSLARAALGLFLLVQFVNAANIAGARPLMLVAGVGAIGSVAVSIGWHDRVAAGAVIAALAYLGLSLPVRFVSGLPFIIVLVLVHIAVPGSPFGSWSSRRRTDPDNEWAMPQWTMVSFWVLLAAGYASLGSGAALSIAGLVLLHLFAIDPRWVPRPEPKGREWIFYDGHCGLCHRAVRFVLAEDHRAHPFRFAPLEGDMFRRAVPQADRAALPDSIVVLTDLGTSKTRSDAVIHALHRLGGYWRVLGTAAWLVPRRVRDALYNRIARVRKRLFPMPEDVCPIVPERLRSRFDVSGAGGNGNGGDGGNGFTKRNGVTEII